MMRSLRAKRSNPELLKAALILVSLDSRFRGSDNIYCGKAFRQQKLHAIAPRRWPCADDNGVKEGDWGLGTGDWGLGIGDWGLGSKKSDAFPSKSYS